MAQFVAVIMATARIGLAPDGFLERLAHRPVAAGRTF